MASDPSILLTRRRLVRLMFWLTFLVSLAAGATSLITQNPAYLPQVVIPLLLWFQFRRNVPSSGIRVETIEGNRYTILLLVWLSLCLVFAMLMFAVDYLVMGHKVQDPVQLYHWIAFGIYFVIVITVASLLDRMKKKAAIQIAHENADGQTATERPL